MMRVVRKCLVEKARQKEQRQPSNVVLLDTCRVSIINPSTSFIQSQKIYDFFTTPHTHPHTRGVALPVEQELIELSVQKGLLD
jgi:hypothetical protein